MKHTMTIHRGAEGETVTLPSGEVIPLTFDVRRTIVQTFAEATNQPTPRRYRETVAKPAKRRKEKVIH